ncbi:flagellin biosynthesis protein FlgD [Flavobacterium commune]|uniref:Flagellin biosynthesis protein FlgD n=1 Tax=Flavobacterium commune TaxID=1306519 RepID=A0A1D9PEL1_9FLAO|nr:flagellin biosynthesis protein FlgD [Flavobacterium commune]
MKTALAGAFIFLISFQTNAQSSKYKCMLQMSNYAGEGAYVVVSLINAKGDYEKTLYVMGDDKKWYNSLKEWHKFNSKKPSNISAITGASVTGGDRSMTTIEIDDSKINKGYKLRFESAVENQKYHVSDVEIPLTTAGIAAKSEGKGYIRYVRLSKI